MNCVKTESYIQQHTYQCWTSKFVYKYSCISMYGSISSRSGLLVLKSLTCRQLDWRSLLGEANIFKIFLQVRTEDSRLSMQVHCNYWIKKYTLSCNNNKSSHEYEIRILYLWENSSMKQPVLVLLCLQETSSTLDWVFCLNDPND